jgi:hypothetical protein
VYVEYMATKPVTIRLDESTLNYLDELATAWGRKHADQDHPDGIRVKDPTRSDMIRVAVTGWLSDHDAALVRLVEEYGDDICR